MMSYFNAFNFDKIKTDFNEITLINTELDSKKVVINEKLEQLKTTYNNLIKANNKKIFLFCLDSFYFQYKVINIELDNLTRFSTLITNRMYGDYYKLYNIIIAQISDKNIRIKSASENKKFQIYKDLDPFHEYTIPQISEVHDAILEVILDLNRHYNQLEQSTYNYSANNHVGISITNFINTLEYENVLIREQINLYINYLSFFHASHKKHLTKIYHQFKTFEMEIEHDLETNNMDSNKNNENVKIHLESFYTMTDNVNVENSYQNENIFENNIENHNNQNILEEKIGNALEEEPSENVTQPSENVTQPSENVTQPSENVIQSTENVAQTTENVIQPSENVIQPSEIQRIENTKIE